MLPSDQFTQAGAQATVVVLASTQTPFHPSENEEEERDLPGHWTNGQGGGSSSSSGGVGGGFDGGQGKGGALAGYSGGTGSDGCEAGSDSGDRSDGGNAGAGSRFGGDMLRVCLVLLLWALAMAGKNSLDHIVALLGSLCSAPLALIVPPLMHAKVLQHRNDSHNRNRTRRNNNDDQQHYRQTPAHSAQEEQQQQQQEREGGCGGCGGDDEEERRGEFSTQREEGEKERGEEETSFGLAKAVDNTLIAVGVVITVATSVLVLATWGDAASR